MISEKGELNVCVCVSVNLCMYARARKCLYVGARVPAWTRTIVCLPMRECPDCVRLCSVLLVPESACI